MGIEDWEEEDPSETEELRSEVFRQGDRANEYLRDIRAALWTISMLLGYLAFFK